MDKDKHLKFGSLDKATQLLVKPYLASKENKYMCPYCLNDTILCCGDVIDSYFRHTPNSCCTSFNNMNKGETAEHSSAKYLLKNRFDSGDVIEIFKKCNCCEYTESFKIKKKKKYECIIETFKLDGNKHPDIAITKDGKLKYIIEVYHTHKTDIRPGLWFDIYATDILNNKKLFCCRPFKCLECSFKFQQQEIMNN